MHVLERYYKEVLKKAGKRSGTLKKKLSTIQNQAGIEEFQRAFFEVLSQTRDIEDVAFEQFMGLDRRLPAPTSQPARHIRTSPGSKRLSQGTKRLDPGEEN